jgi:hypothetical protein
MEWKFLTFLVVNREENIFHPQLPMVVSLHMQLYYQLAEAHGSNILFACDGTTTVMKNHIFLEVSDLHGSNRYLHCSLHPTVVPSHN